MRKKVDIDAPFHTDRDIKSLKEVVIEARDIIKRLPGGAPEAQREVNIAYKGIVAERQAPKKVKPILNVEDVYGV